MMAIIQLGGLQACRAEQHAYRWLVFLSNDRSIAENVLWLARALVLVLLALAAFPTLLAILKRDGCLGILLGLRPLVRGARKP